MSIFSRAECDDLECLGYLELAERVADMSVRLRPSKYRYNKTAKKAYSILQGNYRFLLQYDKLYSRLYDLDWDLRCKLEEKAISNASKLAERLTDNCEEVFEGLSRVEKRKVVCHAFIQIEDLFEDLDVSDGLRVKLLVRGIACVKDLRDYFIANGNFCLDNSTDIGRELLDAFDLVCPISKYFDNACEVRKVVPEKYRKPYSESTEEVLRCYSKSGKRSDIYNYYLRKIPYDYLGRDDLVSFIKYIPERLGNNANVMGIILAMEQLSDKDTFNLDKIITCLWKVGDIRKVSPRIIANVILNITSVTLVAKMLEKGIDYDENGDYERVSKKYDIPEAYLRYVCRVSGVSANRFDSEMKKFKDHVESFISMKESARILVEYCGCRYNNYLRLEEMGFEFL